MKIQLPIDTSQVKFIAMALPEPVVDRATKQQRADSNGEPLYSMDLGCIVAKGVGKGGDVINVKLVGAPHAGIREGEPVKVTGLTITDYAVDNRFGLTFRAARIPVPVGGPCLHCHRGWARPTPELLGPAFPSCGRSGRNHGRTSLS